jgi:GDP-L-fucose synthase
VAAVPLSLDSRIYVAGHNGLVGSAVWRHLQEQGFTDLVGWRSAEVDLRDRAATFDAVLSARPSVVVVAAAKVGGIMANSSHPVDFLNDNLRIQTNLFEASHAADVNRLLFLGSSCIYPKLAPQPIPESALLTGPLEPTNDAYAIAKIAGIMAMKSYRNQYGRHWISAMPTNLYGPGDNFDLTSSHVLPAMIRKFHEATVSGGSVTVWGTGAPMREFLHVDDLASAVLHLLRVYDSPETINVGTGVDVTIRELASTIADVVGYTGQVVWDSSKPDGTPRKLLDVSRLRALGWEPRIGLREGIASTYEWYLANGGAAS